MQLVSHENNLIKEYTFDTLQSFHKEQSDFEQLSRTYSN